MDDFIKRKAKAKLIAVIGPVFIYVVLALGAIGLAMTSVIAFLTGLATPSKAIREWRQDVIYTSIRGMSNVYEFDQAYFDSLGIADKGLEAAMRVEVTTFDNSTSRLYFPSIKATDFESLGNGTLNKEQYVKEHGVTTLYYNMSNYTYEYRMPWQYVSSLALTKKFGSKEAFERLVSARLESLNADGSFSDKGKDGRPWYEKFTDSIGLTDGKVELSRKDVYSLFGAADKDDIRRYFESLAGKTQTDKGILKYSDYKFDIDYFGLGLKEYSETNKNIEPDVVNENAVEILNDIVRSKGIHSGDRYFSNMPLSRAQTYPYITYKGYIYPASLIKRAENFCAVYSDFDYVKVQSGDYKLIDGVKVYDTRYELVYYKKTYKIANILRQWRELGITEEQDELMFQLLEAVCTGTGCAVYNELHDAYVYYKMTGKEMISEYRSNDASVAKYVQEYPVSDSLLTMNRDGLSLIGLSTDSARINMEVAKLLADTGWGSHNVYQKSGGSKTDLVKLGWGSLYMENWRDVDVCLYAGNHLNNTSNELNNARTYPTIATTLNLAEILYRYGMPYEDSRAGDTLGKYGSRDFYFYNDTGITTGYNSGGFRSFNGTSVWSGNIFHYYKDKIVPWGSLGGSGQNSRTSVVGLSSAGFIEYILSRSLWLDRYDYRLRTNPEKSTNQYGKNYYPTCVNLYDYADYRFVDPRELVPGDLGFLSPTDDDSKNLVGIYMGNYLVNDRSVNKSDDELKEHLSDKYIHTAYNKVAHVFLVCCPGDGISVGSGVNKVILYSDSVSIPGIPSMDFKYFARYCDVYDGEVIDGRAPASNEFVSFVEWNSGVTNAAQLGKYQEYGFKSSWYDTFKKAREYCIVAFDEEKRVNPTLNAAKDKSVLLFGSDGKGGAVKRAADMLMKELRISENDAMRYANGILGYGYGVNFGEGEFVVDSSIGLTDTAKKIEKLKAGTYFWWPLANNLHYVTEHFGYYTEPGYTHKFHYAVDISGQGIVNAPLIAMADGVVVSAFESIGGGKTVTVMYDEDLGLSSTYKHCNDIMVSVGQRVTQGTVVALAGNTGTDSTGPHLHVEMLYGSRYDDVNKRFAITDLFDYDWTSTALELTEEEKKARTHYNGKEEEYKFGITITTTDIE